MGTYSSNGPHPTPILHHLLSDSNPPNALISHASSPCQQPTPYRTSKTASPNSAPRGAPVALPTRLPCLPLQPSQLRRLSNRTRSRLPRAGFSPPQITQYFRSRPPPTSS